MPVLASDVITFHVEFESTSNPRGSTTFYRDAMECKVTKQTTTNYWDTTVSDMYVRTTETTAAVADFNNAVELDG